VVNIVPTFIGLIGELKEPCVPAAEFGIVVAWLGVNIGIDEQAIVKDDAMFSIEYLFASHGGKDI
jgi:hypothetical protein